ncbi:lyase family protein [Amycolatopsis rhabdoformis]|uniref:Lyase family protein n=1 Tax=Amycolatopsis rhabdoformis TaxID=1448059 RepID=A0ABZ1II66_9PSEU|nr:lyase family protein [Amycolatopsis rhabdoformis]WSE34155.1 lyase family protein [Amycolatopsis rhabdoformis]
MSTTAPADTVLYGEQTRKALAHLPAHGRRLSDVPALLTAYAQVKAAAARANAELGVLDPARADAIARAAAEVAAGHHRDQFPLTLVQGGGGTSTNMNVNEVLAARAEQLLAAAGTPLAVHPNDHVNRSQSTNDTYPTAMALATAELAEPVLAALGRLSTAFDTVATDQGGLVRLGRTCLQDAVLLTVAQTHRAHAHAIRRTRAALQHAVAELAAVPLGATAVGTGIGSPDGYADLVVRHLAAVSGKPVTAAEDYFDALAHLDGYATVAAALVRASGVLGKIARDLRLLSSGPVGGLGEVRLPELQAGSSIMPGKVNPVVPELVIQLGFRIRGAAATVDAAADAGELELNVMEPVVVDALAGAFADLTAAATIFREKCVERLQWDTEAVARHAAGALDQYVTLATTAGYRTAVGAATSAGESS